MSTLRITMMSPEEEELYELGKREAAVSRLARKFMAGFEVLLNEESARVLARMAVKFMEDKEEICH
jgi:hypothetical protein